MSTAAAWMPFYVGDYLGDTQRLTTEQHGAYLLLMLDYWRNGPAPDDDAVLQQITKLDKAAWKKHRPALSRMFQIDGGEWRHKRIDRELENASANAERRSNKAKAAAQARWGDAASNAPSMPQALPVECPPPSPRSVTFTDVKDNGAIDPEKQFWDSAKSYLSGVSRNPGALIGKWHKSHDRQVIRDAITRSQLERALEPISFIEGCLRHQKRATAEEFASPC